MENRLTVLTTHEILFDCLFILGIMRVKYGNLPVNLVYVAAAAPTIVAISVSIQMTKEQKYLRCSNIALSVFLVNVAVNYLWAAYPLGWISAAALSVFAVSEFQATRLLRARLEAEYAQMKVILERLHGKEYK